MQYILVFLEGMLTFISPCLLPMLPVFIFYFMGGEEGASKKRVLARALCFVLGFTLLFVLMGAFAGGLMRAFVSHTRLVNIIGGAIVVLFGLTFLDIIHIPLFRGMGAAKPAQSPLAALLLGAVFAVSWTPCVGAFLGSALVLASREGSALSGALMLLLYSLGLGLPFILAALLLDRLRSAFDWFKKHGLLISRLSGVLLIALGLLMMTGLLDRLFNALL